MAVRHTLLNSPLHTIAFINQQVISAGAMIALACNTIVMSEGRTVGAAVSVIGGAGGSKPADEKSVSCFRKEFRATAEVRRRPPEFAEPMVDASAAARSDLARPIRRGCLPIAARRHCGNRWRSDGHGLRRRLL